MAAHDRLRWDAIYRERSADDYPAPDPMLFQFAPPRRAGETAAALDIAAGLGQNGLWLAAQGYVVDLIDVSRVALLQAQAEAARRQLHNANFFQRDLDDARFERESYDVVCVFRFLNRDLMPQIRAAIRPGGRVIYQTFNMRYLNLKPDMNAAYLLGIGELAGFFGDWRILHNSEPEHVSRLVAVKPVN
jgi:2-polyprenyl-3-methyl-5-hydroxy-6-metoxy-1,4-benzoquinol methylase